MIYGCDTAMKLDWGGGSLSWPKFLVFFWLGHASGFWFCMTQRLAKKQSPFPNRKSPLRNGQVQKNPNWRAPV